MCQLISIDLAAIRKHALLILYIGLVTLQSMYFFVTYENFPHAGVAGTDQVAYYSFVASVVVDHDLDMRNQLYDLNYNSHGIRRWDSLPRSPHNGLPFNRYPVGYSLMVTPTFLSAHALSHILFAISSSELFQPNGYTLIYEFMAVLSTIFYAALAFYLLTLALSDLFPQKVCQWTVFVMFLAYPGSYYTVWGWANSHI
ncbi:MAG: hypothetical protein ACOCVL_02275, partial [Candidatus Sumerlaeota bacterium]